MRDNPRLVSLEQVKFPFTARRMKGAIIATSVQSYFLFTDIIA
ncbi:hypothetical protein MJ1HA_1098 [Metallosphaera sedula]|nr:hypothetical protein MJ1HA_1098 [Metallosphaera sedula]